MAGLACSKKKQVRTKCGSLKRAPIKWLSPSAQELYCFVTGGIIMMPVKGAYPDARQGAIDAYRNPESNLGALNTNTLQEKPRVEWAPKLRGPVYTCFLASLLLSVGSAQRVFRVVVENFKQLLYLSGTALREVYICILIYIEGAHQGQRSRNTL